MHLPQQFGNYRYTIFVLLVILTALIFTFIGFHQGRDTAQKRYTEKLVAETQLIRNKYPPLPTPTPFFDISKATLGAKTVTSKQLGGYSFSYPSDWKVLTSQSGIKLYRIEDASVVRQLFGTDKEKFMITITPFMPGKKFDDIFQIFLDIGADSKREFNATKLIDVNADGKPDSIYSFYGVEPFLTREVYMLKSPNEVLQITAGKYLAGEKTTLDGIVASLQFITDQEKNASQRKDY